MRIIRGSHRGRKIVAPANLPVRPTTDLAKESLFNVMENLVWFDELRVLDLYAGTGSISYEFASRGARLVLAVDINPRCVKFIADTAAQLGFGQLRAIRSASLGFLQHSSTEWDLIFADPPYDLPGLDEIPATVFEKNLLAEGGWLILEHSREHDFSSHPNFDRHKNYGKVNFTFFRK
jgi:16S rRNA (guanine(966)-N(2))-methyltransferase RsmD